MQISKGILTKVNRMSNEEIANQLFKYKTNPKKVDWELARSRVAERLQGNANMTANFNRAFRRSFN
jgi:hypothetical protein|tara:strand:- start:412 stop:609 length:198 start_codon:yes stop_codon:yes gene_type:complete